MSWVPDNVTAGAPPRARETGQHVANASSVLASAPASITPAGSPATGVGGGLPNSRRKQTRCDTSCAPNRIPATSPCGERRRAVAGRRGSPLARREHDGSSGERRRLPRPARAWRQRARTSAGCDDGGPSSSRASMSTSLRRARESSSSRSGDGGLASSRCTSSRSCITRSSSGSIPCPKSVVAPRFMRRFDRYPTIGEELGYPM